MVAGRDCGQLDETWCCNDGSRRHLAVSSSRVWAGSTRCRCCFCTRRCPRSRHPGLPACECARRFQRARGVGAAAAAVDRHPRHLWWVWAEAQMEAWWLGSRRRGSCSWPVYRHRRRRHAEVCPAPLPQALSRLTSTLLSSCASTWPTSGCSSSLTHTCSRWAGLRGEGLKAGPGMGVLPAEAARTWLPCFPAYQPVAPIPIPWAVPLYCSPAG